MIMSIFAKKKSKGERLTPPPPALVPTPIVQSNLNHRLDRGIIGSCTCIMSILQTSHCILSNVDNFCLSHVLYNLNTGSFLT